MRLLLGIAIGACAVGFLWVSGVTVEDVGNHAKSTATGLAKAAGETAAEIEYDDCVVTYLAESNCHDKFSLKVCRSEINKACGKDPSPPEDPSEQPPISKVDSKNKPPVG